jgi:hypothetical protein
MQHHWEKRLKSAYAAHAMACGKPSRSVRLPNGISFAGEGEEVQLSLSAECVTDNMQSNRAAFEGWSLALRRWCEVKVVLQWTPSPPDASASHRQHYQRFLYRVARFQSLFDWFRIEPRNEGEIDAWRALERRPLFLNVGGARGPEQESASEGDSESALEHRLLKSSEFAAHYGLVHGTRDRQLPVGLFSEKTPSRGSRIFPGGKGAIDLVCLDADTLWLFELKAGENIPAGIVSELFFYTSVLRDALQGGPFTFAEAHPKARTKARIQPEALSRVTHIEGVMLGHDLHPLVDSGLISILNEAVEKRWNAEPSRAHVRFRADRITEGGELTIAPVD